MLAGSLIGVGALAFESWLWSVWRSDDAPPAQPVAPAAPTARLPDYQLPPPEPTYVNVPVVKEVPRDRVVERAAPQPPATARGDPSGYQPPQAIAWDVKLPGLELDWYLDGRRPQLAPGCALRPGATIIAAKLVTEIRSEIGGQAIAEVMSDVFDVDGAGRVLIPQGTRVVGLYKRGGLDFQDRRLDFVWAEMTFPDGRQLTLGEAAGMDAAGAMGVGGEVQDTVGRAAGDGSPGHRVRCRPAWGRPQRQRLPRQPPELGLHHGGGAGRGGDAPGARLGTGYPDPCRYPDPDLAAKDDQGVLT